MECNQIEVDDVITLSDDQTEFVAQESQQNEVRLMKESFKRIMGLKRNKRFYDPIEATIPEFATMGLIGIKEKLDTYQNIDEYLSDINCLVRSYTSRFFDDADLTGKVKQLREECTRDVTSIQACAECFQSWIDDRYNFFTNVCSKPHLLVFAKVASYLPWPAKVMSTCGDKVNVEFFGDHSQADVSFKQCTLYRKNITKPVKKDAKKSAPYKLYNDALEELKQHIIKIEKKFGSICTTVKATHIDPDNVTYQKKAMFPGAYKEDNINQTCTTPIDIKDEIVNSVAERLDMPLLNIFDVTQAQDSSNDDIQDPFVHHQHQSKQMHQTIEFYDTDDEIPLKRIAQSQQKLQTIEFDDSDDELPFPQIHLEKIALECHAGVVENEWRENIVSPTFSPVLDRAKSNEIDELRLKNAILMAESIRLAQKNKSLELENANKAREILNLKNHIISAGKVLECANCGRINPHDKYFCNQNCQFEYE